VAFDILPPQSQEFIKALAGNIEAGTHLPQVTRYSGDSTDPRSRLVQKAVPGGQDYVILMEGYGAGDALNRVIAKGYLKGSWISADTWEGEVDPSALEEYRKG
jgi:hypothetical protein